MKKIGTFIAYLVIIITILGFIALIKLLSEYIGIL